MLLRNVAQHRTTVLFRGLPGVSSCSKSKSTKSTDSKHIQNEPKDKRRNRDNKKEKNSVDQTTQHDASDAWDIRKALLSPTGELGQLVQSRNIMQEGEKTISKVEWGPKARLVRVFF